MRVLAAFAAITLVANAAPQPAGTCPAGPTSFSSDQIAKINSMLTARGLTGGAQSSPARGSNRPGAAAPQQGAAGRPQGPAGGRPGQLPGSPSQSSGSSGQLSGSPGQLSGSPGQSSGGQVLPSGSSGRASSQQPPPQQASSGGRTPPGLASSKSQSQSSSTALAPVSQGLRRRDPAGYTGREMANMAGAVAATAGGVAWGGVKQGCTLAWWCVKNTPTLVAPTVLLASLGKLRSEPEYFPFVAEYVNGGVETVLTGLAHFTGLSNAGITASTGREMLFAYTCSTFNAQQTRTCQALYQKLMPMMEASIPQEFFDKVDAAAGGGGSGTAPQGQSQGQSQSQSSPQPRAEDGIPYPPVTQQDKMAEFVAVVLANANLDNAVITVMPPPEDGQVPVLKIASQKVTAEQAMQVFGDEWDRAMDSFVQQASAQGFSFTPPPRPGSTGAAAAATAGAGNGGGAGGQGGRVTAGGQSSATGGPSGSAATGGYTVRGQGSPGGRGA
ncbi:hypothetical protein C1H76_4403 [Elsinoe australis]|uniref:Uncharacterized protein n=1 Tax=Elsinoe australis TaxID=40998 RepID=A0A4U7B3K2_9PEZI|nr:hypothetical protein C1H76_4403 [Elsinoe australis]